MRRAQGWWWVLACGLALGAHELWFAPAAREAGRPATMRAAPAPWLVDGVEGLARLELHAGGHLRAVERAAGGWRYAPHGQGPVQRGAAVHGGDVAQAPGADASFIAERLAMFAMARIERSFTRDAAAATYGFTADAPRLVLYRRDDGRARPGAAGARGYAEYTIGAPTPDGFGRYLRAAGGRRVMIVAAYHVENLYALFARVP